MFCSNVSPKHLVLQCFQCSGIQKPCKILLCTMFFSFLAVFPLPESYQNDPKFHFNTLLGSDTQKSSKNVENTTEFWSRCETVFGVWSRRETVFGPPPAKADIATAILTNVIEHLVLLLPPNKHAFTAKAVWADFKCGSSSFSISKTACLSDPCTAVYTQRIPTYSSRFVRSILAARCDDLARIVKPRGRSRSIEVE